MIGKIERGESQPTAALLGRLSATLGMTLSALLSRVEEDDGRLRRSSQQSTWTDPLTGYRRRAVSPAGGGPLELVEVELPPGAEVSYPADAYAFIHQQIWILSGRLSLREGDSEHDLRTGDCLQLGQPTECVFANRTTHTCRYLVVLARRAG